VARSKKKKKTQTTGPAPSPSSSSRKRPKALGASSPIAGPLNPAWAEEADKAVAAIVEPRWPTDQPPVGCGE
jgi:hypothetical protein